MLLHLSYHAILVAGVDAAFALMHTLRVFYRWLPVEALILGSVLVQLATGPVLARRQAQRPQRNRVAALSGYYLFFFSIVHVAAVLWGRLGMEVDTSIHFAAAGLHAWPAAAFFFPYYFLAVVAAFVHLGHALSRRLGRPAVLLPLVVGTTVAGLVLAGMAGVAGGLTIPTAYR
ncbi:hypothetical protein [Massilia sp. LjRoot122]|uniref:hypothetical protein n=1 Tax=Massilia sp. LjRoot122 TaxID=3342257 RepID=UPI003ED04684